MGSKSQHKNDQVRSRILEDDQVEDDLEPPPEPNEEELRSHLSPSGRLPLLPQRSASGGGAPVVSPPPRRNLGTYFPGAGAAAAAAGAAVPGSTGRTGGS